MKTFQIPSLPKDILLGKRQGPSKLLAAAAQAVANVPQIPGVQVQSEAVDPEAVGTLIYLADLLNKLFEKLETLAVLPLEDFAAQADAYVDEVVAHLPDEARTLFLNRANVYVAAQAAQLQAEQELSENNFNHETFLTLMAHLESRAIQAVMLPEHVQAQIIATAVADYRHTLQAGEDLGFITPGASDVMLQDLQEEMAQSVVKNNLSQTDEPTLLALKIASGETGAPEVDELPKEVRMGLLEETLKNEEVQ